MQELFGTRTSADINLVAQALMLVGLWVGFYFARTHNRRRHADIQTTIVLVQLFFIAFVMITSFYSFVISDDSLDFRERPLDLGDRSLRDVQSDDLIRVRRDGPNLSNAGSQDQDAFGCQELYSP